MNCQRPSTSDRSSLHPKRILGKKVSARMRRSGGLAPEASSTMESVSGGGWNPGTARGFPIVVTTSMSCRSEEGLGEDAALRRPRAGSELDDGERLGRGMEPGNGEGLPDRRHDVDELHRNRHVRSREGRLLLTVFPGELHEKWDLNGLAVKEHPVLALAVVSEPLTVVREEHDHRTVVEASRLQVFEER